MRCWMARLRRKETFTGPRRLTATSLKRPSNTRDVPYVGLWDHAMPHRSVADATHFRANDEPAAQPTTTKGT